MFNSEKTKIRVINEALDIGEKSGLPKSFDNESFKLKMQKKLTKDT